MFVDSSKFSHLFPIHLDFLSLALFSSFNLYSCKPCKLVRLCRVFMCVSCSDVRSLDEHLVALRANGMFK